MCQVIQLSDYIPRKPADRIVWEPPHPEWRHYQCTDCGQEDQFRRRRPDTAVYCGCGAEMRPVEMEAK